MSGQDDTDALASSDPTLPQSVVPVRLHAIFHKDDRSLGETELPLSQQQELERYGEQETAARHAGKLNMMSFVPALDASPTFDLSDDEVNTLVESLKELGDDDIDDKRALMADTPAGTESFRAVANRMEALSRALSDLALAQGSGDASRVAPLRQALSVAIDRYNEPVKE